MIKERLILELVRSVNTRFQTINKYVSKFIEQLDTTRNLNPNETDDADLVSFFFFISIE